MNAIPWPIEPGCYVDGGQCNAAEAVSATISVGIELGAVSAPYADDELYPNVSDPDKAQCIIDEVVELLNDHAVDGENFVWNWVDGDLMLVDLDDPESGDIAEGGS